MAEWSEALAYGSEDSRFESTTRHRRFDTKLVNKHAWSAGSQKRIPSCQAKVNFALRNLALVWQNVYSAVHDEAQCSILLGSGRKLLKFVHLVILGPF